MFTLSFLDTMEGIVKVPTPIVEVSPIQISVKPNRKGLSQNIIEDENIFTFSNIAATSLGRKSSLGTSHSSFSSSYTQMLSSRQSSVSSYNDTSISPIITPSFKSTCSLKKASSFSNFQKSFILNGEDPLSNSSSFTSVCPLTENKYHPLQIRKNSYYYDDNNHNEYENIVQRETQNDNTNQLENQSLELHTDSLINNSSNTISIPTIANNNNDNKFSISDCIHNFNNSFNLTYSVSNHFNNMKIFQDIPLETFSQKFESLPTQYDNNININSTLPDFNIRIPIHLNGKTTYMREQRTNPKYLLIYAQINSIRINNIFKDISDLEIDIFDDILLERYAECIECIGCISNNCLFDSLFRLRLKESLQNSNIFKKIDSQYINLIKLASISRFKICSMIDLQPRNDPLPNMNNIIDNILPNNISIENFNKPWLNLIDFKSEISSINKSAGLLKFGKNIQYVSKNSYSKRWISYTHHSVLY